MSSRRDSGRDGTPRPFFAVATVGAGGEITLPAGAGLEAGDEVLFAVNPPGLFPPALIALEREAFQALLSDMTARVAALAVEWEAAPPDQTDHETNQRRVG